MSIVVFYLTPDGTPKRQLYIDDDFVIALQDVQALRREGNSHVVMSTELGDMVGKPGVDTVKDGKTPDGHDYEWSKQHRGAGPRKDS